MKQELTTFMKAAAGVKPSKRQLDWFDMELYAFVHFTVNTYTGKEWGDGTESPSIFNPTELDCDEWVQAVKAAGAKGLVLTAKHHDGFCLWPSAYTEHSIKNSPYKNGKGDIVREAAEACRRGGIKFGLYLSPWDRNHASYGTPAYNDFYANQLTELLTGYGELFLIWQDGACGEGPDGKKQAYDFDRYNALIRKYQPNACIFNDFGPDVRWCGNESGSARPAEWAVVPSELCFRSEKQTDGPVLEGTLAGLYNADQEIGALSNILYSKGLVFTGAEVDMSIRPGWFYHPDEEPHSLQRLFDTYLRTVGHNACLHLNVPPMPNGRFDPRDIARLKEFGEAVREAFGRPLHSDWEKTEAHPSGQCVYRVTLERPADIRYVTLLEDIAQGQRAESFRIHLDGEKACRYSGFTIGHKQICPMPADTQTQTFLVTVTAARDEVLMKDILVYGDPL